MTADLQARTDLDDSEEPAHCQHAYCRDPWAYDVVIRVNDPRLVILTATCIKHAARFRERYSHQIIKMGTAGSLKGFNLTVYRDGSRQNPTTKD